MKKMIIVLTMAALVLSSSVVCAKEDRYVFHGNVETEIGTLNMDELKARYDDALQVYYDKETGKVCWVYSMSEVVNN